MSHAEVMAHQRAELLVQSVTDYAIYMLDPDGIVVSWNAGAERFKGYYADEIIGQHFSRFYPEEDRAAGVPDRALQTALEEGRFEAEGWRVRKDGTRFWANVVVDTIRDPAGRHLGFAKVTRDLTERRRVEEALRRSEERFRLLVKGVIDYAIYMLDPEGRVTSWNAGAERFKGYTEAEIIGRHFSEFYLEDDRRAGIPEQALSTARREGRFEAEGWRRRKDGSRFWASVVIDAVHDPDGELIGFAKITRDLTERKEAQEALDVAREQFFQSQKLEAIGKLTGGVAHDFNNLLSAILSSLDLTKRRLQQGKDPGSMLDNAIKAAERGADLTQRMLAFARKQELRLQAVDIAESLRGMAGLLGSTIEPDCQIETRLPLLLPKVWADPAQLELSLINLVVNARDAMPEGGRILISAREAEVPRASGAPLCCVCLSVEDEGMGMDQATLEHATEPFFTTKGVGKGTGLGLPMVQGLAEQCGGRFELRSTPGKGTVAEVCLPIADRQNEPCAKDKQVAEVTAVPPLRVLAVDDDPIVLTTTAAMLSDLGHQVHPAASAQAALAILAANRIDLLLTDYAMPAMTGAELGDRARALRPDLAIVTISGFADLPKGTELPGLRLAKPFREHQLAAVIAEAMQDRPAEPKPARQAANGW